MDGLNGIDLRNRARWETPNITFQTNTDPYCYNVHNEVDDNSSEDKSGDAADSEARLTHIFS